MTPGKHREADLDEREKEFNDLRALLREFTLFVSAMTREINRDTERVIVLSDEAVEEVGKNFMQIGNLAGRLREILKSAAEDDDTRMDRALLLAEIKNETDKAVRNLQHQDIISQILNASGKQLARLEETSQRIYDAASQEDGIGVAQLQQMHEDLQALIEDIQSGACHPVAQSSMQAGSVDLF